MLRTTVVRRIAISIWAGVLLLLSQMAGYAARGQIALVIGNGGYSNAPTLANPPLDARAVAAALQGVGFDVDLKIDLDRKTTMAALKGFSEKADKAGVALFYYAGHGLQMPHDNSGENFLVPVDARLLDVRDVDEETISLDRALRWLSGAKSRVVILDACRDNPMASHMRGLSGTRRISRGLAVPNTVPAPRTAAPAVTGGGIECPMPSGGTHIMS